MTDSETVMVETIPCSNTKQYKTSRRTHFGKTSMPEDRHNFKVEEFRTTLSIQQCFKCQVFGHKAPNCTKKQKCVVCGEAHSHKNCPNQEKETQNVPLVEDLMSPTTETVLLTRIKPSGNI